MPENHLGCACRLFADLGWKSTEISGNLCLKPRKLLILKGPEQAGSQEVRGSIPLSSTNRINRLQRIRPKSRIRPFASPALNYAADSILARMIRGCFAAMRKSASAGPSGMRRPCSQFLRV